MNVVRKNLHQANVSGLACGHAAVNATLLSSNLRHSNRNRCVTLPAMVDAAERKVQVPPREVLLQSDAGATSVAMTLAMVLDMVMAMVMDITGPDMAGMDLMDHSGTDHSAHIYTADTYMAALSHITKYPT